MEIDELKTAIELERSLREEADAAALAAAQLLNDTRVGRVIGGIIVARQYHPQFEAEVIEARGEDLPAFSRDGTPREMKWTKVSPPKLEAYKRVIDTFFSFANKMPLSTGHVDFHCVVVDAHIKAGRMSEAGYNKEIAVLGQKLVRSTAMACFACTWILEPLTTRLSLSKTG
jgi:hypothetical protein